MLNLSLRYVNLVMLLNSLDAVAAILYLYIDKLTCLLPPRYYLKNNFFANNVLRFTPILSFLLIDSFKV